MTLLRHPVVGRALDHRPLRFLLVGGLNTMFGYGAFAALLFLGLGPSVALTLATILGVAFNFVTSGSLTFGSRDMTRLPAFCLTYAVLFVLDLVALHGFVLAGVRPAVGQAALVLPLAALSYVLQRDLVFRVRPQRGRSVRALSGVSPDRLLRLDRSNVDREQATAPGHTEHSAK